MLTDLQKFCFELFEKNSDEFPTELHSKLQNVLLGDEDAYFLREKLENILKNEKKSYDKADANKKNFLKLFKLLQDQKDSFFKYDRVVGFRRKCLEMYFDFNQKKYQDDPTLRAFMSALRNFVFSGKESDLRKLLKQHDKLAYIHPQVFQNFNMAVNVQLNQFNSAYNTFYAAVHTPHTYEFFTAEMRENAHTILADAEKIISTKSGNKASKILLVDVLGQTHRALQNPHNDHEIKACLQLSRKLDGSTVYWQRVVGCISMLVGGLAIMSGILLMPTFIGGAVIAGGVAALAGGYGLFAKGAKKGLSLHVSDLAHETNHQKTERIYYNMLDEAMSRPTNTAEEEQLKVNYISGLLSLHNGGKPF